MKSLIQKLVETNSPSGYESNIREAVRAEIAPYVDEIYIDALGNLIARKGQKTGQGLKVMLSAHVDEIGLIATHIDEQGFVSFSSIGGVRAMNCVGGRVRFQNGSAGVIFNEPLDDPSRAPAIEQLYIDLGASSRKDCPVKVGDVAVFERPYAEFGSRLVSKAMDDRIGAVVLIEALRQIKTSPHELFFVFSVQEEVGLRGATTAAYGIDPDLGVAADVTGTGDTPRRVSRRMAVSLGKGPAIKVRDGGMLSDPRVVQWMVRTAEKARLPYQLEILEGGTTDARAIQLSRAGVPAGCISIPCRYIHSPSEMVDLRDVENAVRLLVELLQNPVNLDERT
jgi:endoglucanase